MTREKYFLRRRRPGAAQTGRVIRSGRDFDKVAGPLKSQLTQSGRHQWYCYQTEKTGKWMYILTREIKRS